MGFITTFSYMCHYIVILFFLILSQEDFTIFCLFCFVLNFSVGATHTYGCLRKPEEGIRSPRSVATAFVSHPR